MRAARGFSLLNILISVAIVAILAVTALKDYKGAVRALKPGGGSSSVTSPGFNAATIISQLRQIHAMQLAYQQRYGKFATFAELLEDGSIPKGYAAREDDATGVGFIRGYDLEFSASKDNYIVLAFPNSASAKEFPDDHLPAYRIDQTGEVREEEGLDDAPPPESEDPFALDPADTGADLPEEDIPIDEVIPEDSGEAIE